MNQFWKKYKINGMIGVLLFVLLLVFIMAAYAFIHTIQAVNIGQTTGIKQYEYHFVMIHSGSNDDFWESLYKGAKDAGEEVNSYVEDFGETVPGNYSEEELMDMAIAAKVDGIIVEGTQSDEMKTLINEAESQDITVVTMIHDVAESDRKTYVGVNAYSLGELYGNQVVAALGKKKEEKNTSEDDVQKVTVLIDSTGTDSQSPLVYTSIRETVAKSGYSVQISSLNIENAEDFESEEVIRNLVLNQETRPDVVVNLSSVDTISCSQAIIDYNLVGKITVLGYYSAPEVLDGISKGIIESSVDIDAKKIGATSVEYLHKYILKGYVNEYATVDMRLITSDNVADYQAEDLEDGGE